jgi:hypothetical protein
MTIKLDARAVTRAALLAFQEKDLTNPTPREYLLVGAIVGALCEEIEAATAPTPAPVLRTAAERRAERRAEPPSRCNASLGHGYFCNLYVDHEGGHEWSGDNQVMHEGAVARAAEARALEAEALHSKDDTSPAQVERLIRVAKAGRGGRGVWALVNHYEERLECVRDVRKRIHRTMDPDSTLRDTLVRWLNTALGEDA